MSVTISSLARGACAKIIPLQRVQIPTFGIGLKMHNRIPFNASGPCRLPFRSYSLTCQQLPKDRESAIRTSFSRTFSSRSQAGMSPEESACKILLRLCGLSGKAYEEVSAKCQNSESKLSEWSILECEVANLLDDEGNIKPEVAEVYNGFLKGQSNTYKTFRDFVIDFRNFKKI